jgi:hypothetical protein
MLINTEYQAEFEVAAGLTSPINLINVDLDQQAASNAAEFKDVKSIERRQRRRQRTGRSVRSLGMPVTGWKVSSW